VREHYALARTSPDVDLVLADPRKFGFASWRAEVLKPVWFENAWFGCRYATDRNRRIFLVAAQSGEGLLLEPTAVLKLGGRNRCWRPRPC